VISVGSTENRDGGIVSPASGPVGILVSVPAAYSLERAADSLAMKCYCVKGERLRNGRMSVVGGRDKVSLKLITGLRQVITRVGSTVSGTGFSTYSILKTQS
jgi:hypothetical protein